MPNKNKGHSATPASLINASFAYIFIQFLLIKDKQISSHQTLLGSGLRSRATSKSVYHLFC